MEWNVYRFNPNTDKVETFNVFEHTMFRDECVKAAKKYLVNRKSLEEAVKSAAMYYFWSKFEYEIQISGLLDPDKSAVKIDIYDQLRANWDNFIDYIYFYGGTG